MATKKKHAHLRGSAKRSTKKKTTKSPAAAFKKYSKTVLALAHAFAKARHAKARKPKARKAPKKKSHARKHHARRDPMTAAAGMLVMGDPSWYGHPRLHAKAAKKGHAKKRAHAKKRSHRDPSHYAHHASHHASHHAPHHAPHHEPHFGMVRRHTPSGVSAARYYSGK